MAKASQILGLNAREQLFKSLNDAKVKEIADSKLLTKKFLEEQHVAHPALYAVFDNQEQVDSYDFETIKGSFVIKPNGGSAGKGILIIKKKVDTGTWLDINNTKLTTKDLQLHLYDILEGQYSTFGIQHQAFVEERVPPHKKFSKYAYSGTPDIRVIVFNNVPVMAMLRLPTKESEGRANLHQGAIGVGIDIATGITINGVKGSHSIKYVPNTKKKLNGIKIPHWNATLRTSVQAAIATGMMYGGIDLLMHPDKGPMVVELNASPGLSIQIANNAGLRWRLERVQGLNIRDADHGVRVGRALFAESFADKVKADEGLTIVGQKEKIRVKLPKEKGKLETFAVLDTGRYRSQIRREYVEKHGLNTEKNLLWEKKRGRIKERVIEITFWLKGRKIKTGMSVVAKPHSKADIRIGRRDLDGFLVDITKQAD